jgi:hypothetical protein
MIGHSRAGTLDSCHFILAILGETFSIITDSQVPLPIYGKNITGVNYLEEDCFDNFFVSRPILF